jgi:heme-degrading monooxygenase HmoA
MFVSMRKYHVRRGSAEGLARRVEEGFVPLIRQMQGFRSYYLLDGGPDVLITISLFENADEALASNEKAADWVRNNVLEFTKGMPEVMVGRSLIGLRYARVALAYQQFWLRLRVVRSLLSSWPALTQAST